MDQEIYLREWQRRRLPVLREETFPASRYADQLTLVVYTFPPDSAEEDFFQWIECAILQSWSLLGALKCVIVAHKPFPAVERFARKYSLVELQIEPTLLPGKISTMSYDCNTRLYQRFTTPYCLVIQDDGFPLRDRMDEFLGRWDYIGAPLVRSGFRRHLANFLHLATMNGGFSLRSRAFCSYVSHTWFHLWRHLLPPSSPLFPEDFFYTTTMRLLPLTHWKFRFPDEETAFRFSVDLLDGYVQNPPAVSPLGFHGKYTASRYLPPFPQG